MKFWRAFRSHTHHIIMEELISKQIKDKEVEEVSE